MSSEALPRAIPHETVARLRSELELALATHAARLAEDTEADDLAMAVRRRSEKAHAEISAALARMRSGVYGLCEMCRRSIAVDRLEVVPHSPFCAACAGHERARR